MMQIRRCRRITSRTRHLLHVRRHRLHRRTIPRLPIYLLVLCTAFLNTTCLITRTISRRFLHRALHFRTVICLSQCVLLVQNVSTTTVTTKIRLICGREHSAVHECLECSKISSSCSAVYKRNRLNRDYTTRCTCHMLYLLLSSSRR